jgi:hypothetical protein
MLDLRVVPEDEQKLLQWAEAFDNGSESEKANQRHGLELSLERSKERLLRLTDAFLDGAIDRAVFDNRKNALLVEQAGLEERLHNFDEPGLSFVKKMSQYLELARTLFFLYGLAIPEKKRVLVKSFTSNRYVLGKELEITCLPRYKPLAERPKTRNGVPYRVTPRTYEEILKQLRADNQEKEDYC